MTLELDLRAKVEIWRQKQRDGTLSLEEAKQAIEAIRQGRVTAAVASARSKAKSAPTGPTIDTKSFLAGLKGMAAAKKGDEDGQSESTDGSNAA